jgi:hypothetical protein
MVLITDGEPPVPQSEWPRPLFKSSALCRREKGGGGKGGGDVQSLDHSMLMLDESFRSIST